MSRAEQDQASLEAIARGARADLGLAGDEVLALLIGLAQLCYEIGRDAGPPCEECGDRPPEPGFCVCEQCGASK